LKPAPWTGGNRLDRSPSASRREAPASPAPSRGAEPEHDLLRSFFDRTAAQWQEIYQKTDLYSLLYQERKRIVLALVDEFGDGAGARALDIGCGPGLITLALAQRGYTVEAIDAAAPMIEMTRRLAEQSGAGARIRTSPGDARNLNFADKSFDLVLAVGVTEWLPSLDRPIAEISRVLRPGGVAIVTGDNSWALHLVLDPLSNPLAPNLRRRVHNLLDRLGKRESDPRCYLRSVRELDESLRKGQLQQIRRQTLGFGELLFLHREIFPQTASVWIHRKLQALADRNLPVLRSAGRVYIAAAVKGGIQRAG
jgi:ubiquinone/menaquinone biosynthesis C-methylase UbiE